MAVGARERSASRFAVVSPLTSCTAHRPGVSTQTETAKPMYAVTMFGLPSPFKSPIATEFGRSTDDPVP